MTLLVVNGLVLPRLLARLLDSGGWTPPADRRVLSALGVQDTDDLRFFTVFEMEENSRSLRRLLADGYGDVLGIFSGDDQRGSDGYLDVSRAVVIAGTRGQEALCLDYAVAGEPRVVVTYDDHPGVSWRAAADSIEQLAERLGLSADR